MQNSDEKERNLITKYKHFLHEGSMYIAPLQTTSKIADFQNFLWDINFGEFSISRSLFFKTEDIQVNLEKMKNDLNLENYDKCFSHKSFMESIAPNCYLLKNSTTLEKIPPKAFEGIDQNLFCTRLREAYNVHLHFDRHKGDADSKETGFQYISINPKNLIQNKFIKPDFSNFHPFGVSLDHFSQLPNIPISHF